MIKESKMNKLIIAVLTVGIMAGGAQAQQEYVQGYTRSNGTDVQGYYRSTPAPNYAYQNYNNFQNLQQSNPNLYQVVPMPQAPMVSPMQYGGTYSNPYSR